MKKDIKIYISCHKECEVIQNSMFIPIHVGAARSNTLLQGMLRDDAGENISHKNATYCELTAQYWAWKNVDADYYGFMHYRRYFSFHPTQKYTPNIYNQVCYPTLHGQHALDFQCNEEAVGKLVEEYDIIVPTQTDLSLCFDVPEAANRKDVYTHYKYSKYHHIKDYDFCCNYIRQEYPEYVFAMEKYNRTMHPYFCNMYIMKKEYFHQYCTWLFSILEAYEKEFTNENYNVQENRVMGFLAERLFGIWLTFIQSKYPQLKVYQAQTSFIENTDIQKLQPAFKTNNKAICLAADNRYTPFAGLVISSIMANAKSENNYDIILLSNGIQEQNRELLLRTIQNFKNVSLRFINVESVLRGDFYEKHHINKSCYARLCMPHILSAYDKVVYIDCDTIINRDIADLYDIDISSYYLAAVRDTVDAGWVNQKALGTEENIRNNLGLTEVYNYFNSGVLLLNIEKLKVLFSNNQLIELALSRKWVWQDQDILNYLCHDNVLFLEQNWNVMVHSYRLRSETIEYDAPQWLYKRYLAARENPYIIHFAGRQIPCFMENVDLQEYFWKYAKNSIFYEIFLSYMMEEKILLSVKSHTKMNRYKNIFKRGFASLKHNGLLITLKKIKAKLCSKCNRNKQEFYVKNTKNTLSLQSYKTLSNILLQSFEKQCTQYNLHYWFMYSSLFNAYYKKEECMHEVVYEIALMREDLEKLMQSENPILSFSCKYTQSGVEYTAYLREIPEFKINLYPYDKSSAPTANQAWKDRQIQRIYNISLLQENAAEHAESLIEQLQTLIAQTKREEGDFVVLGWEVPLSVFTSAIAINELYPLQKLPNNNINLYLPYATETVVKRLYLHWQKVRHMQIVNLSKTRIHEIKEILKNLKTI